MNKILLYILIAYPFYMATAQLEPISDENKVPQFQVTDPLTTFEGKKITDTVAWENIRRPELHRFFEAQVYG